MSKHRSHHAAPATAGPSPQTRIHAFLLAALAALLIARPLLPSEAVSYLGDGQPFNMLWLCLAILAALAAVGQGGVCIRLTPTDVAVIELWACYGASALYAVKYA